MKIFYQIYLDYTLFLFFTLALFLTIIFLKFLIPFFVNYKFLDKPNNRSNHVKPVPLGGGLVVIPLIILVSYLTGYVWAFANIFVFISLFFISLVDDFKNIRALYRLIMHFFCIFIFVQFSLLENINFTLYLKEVYLTIFIYFFLIVGITWFINAFNFMDGIDGITAIQIIFLTCSLMFFNLFLNLDNNVLHYCILGVILGFLFYNWHPARIFLGDSGSIPLGFLMLFLLVEFSFSGYWIAVLILPMYYLLDTSITLFIRACRNEKFWQPHSQHFYQKAVRNGQSHKKVCIKIILLSIGLFVFSFLSILEKNNFIFLILSFVWCIFFLFNFSKTKKAIRK